ncbi:hypothetical protein RJT34_00063 [Clitoria ternatea]|uniref:Uncharacterized protein n=1 Tax=Clitoria ternatea TaxID=43366 RepID=A0AAN9KHV6_CLITE
MKQKQNEITSSWVTCYVYGASNRVKRSSVSLKNTASLDFPLSVVVVLLSFLFHSSKALSIHIFNLLFCSVIPVRYFL